MSNRTLWTAAARVDAYLRMVEEAGATAPGTNPPAKYVAALRDAPLPRAKEVADAHAKGSAPPDFAAGNGGGA